MELNGTNFKQKISKKYCCEICHYHTGRKSNIESHMNRAKHKKELNGNNIKQVLSNNIIECELCHKTYQTSAGLWKHKKNGKCIDKNTYDNEYNSNKIIEEVTKEGYNDKDQLILMLIKQNSELIKDTSEFKNMMMEQKNMMMKVIENGTHNKKLKPLRSQTL